MNDLKTAAQQALEAMLNFPDDISDAMFESITALKAALAQQAEPQGCETEEDCTRQPWCRIRGECQRKQDEPRNQCGETCERAKLCATYAQALAQQDEPDLSRCPQCNGPADNGFDRSIPPSPYLCTKCMAEPVTEDMKSAVRWAPSSAYWSQRLRELFGPDAREGIDALERRLAEAQQAEPVPVAWSGYDLDGMVEAFSRVIEAHHSSKHPFHNPIDMDARMALRILRGFIPAMKAYAAPPQQVAQQAEPLNLRDPAVQKRLATQWGYVPAAQAEPVEPVDVGLLEYRGNSVAFIYQKMTAYRAGIDAAWDALRAKGLHPDGKTSLANMIAKYTAPPQRKPLTEKEIDGLVIQHAGYGRDNFYAVARAVERAHGIKE